eukprot:gene5530-9347_t
MGNSLYFRDSSDAYNPSEAPVLMYGGPPTFGPNSYLNQSQYDFFSSNEPTELPVVPKIKKTMLVKSKLNLLKNSLLLVPSSELSYIVQFDVNSEIPFEVSICLLSSEKHPDDFLLQIPNVQMKNEKTVTYTSHLDYPIDMNIYQDDSVTSYPLLIQLKSTEKDENNEYQYQLNYCSIDKVENKNDFTINLMKQKIILKGQVFELTGEIYGNEQEDLMNEDSKNCVICIAEEADVAVLPCRHMCLCLGCAKLLKQQSNKCPLCRTIIESIVKIPIEGSNNIQEV